MQSICLLQGTLQSKGFTSNPFMPGGDCFSGATRLLKGMTNLQWGKGTNSWMVPKSNDSLRPLDKGAAQRVFTKPTHP